MNQTQSAVNPDFDVIVVGGGTNGLSAGCYLGMEGKKVLVLEALDKVGGMASSGYLIPEAPQHLVHPCALDMMSMRVHAHVPAELGLEQHGFKSVELAPGYVYLHPDGQSLIFWRDRERTAAEIRRFSTRDADAFLEFMKVIDLFLEIALPMMRVDPAKANLGVKLRMVATAIRHRALKPELMALMTGSALQAARERFEHPITRSAMCALTGLAGDITADGGGIYYALLGFLHRFGVGRVMGGMQQLSNAMRARLEALGGQVLVSASVSEIVASDGVVKGVKLADGRTFSARAVIAGCHPRPALEMVTAGQLPKHLLTRIAMAPANAKGSGPLKVDVALRGQISLPRFEAVRGDGVDLRNTCLLIGTEEAVLENFAACARGEVPTLPYITMAVPSAADPSQAPAGQDVLYIYPPVMPVNPNEGWDALRERVADQVIEQLYAYVDGIEGQIIGRRIEAAPDFTARLNTVNGCVVHIDTTSMRSSTMRPAHGLGGDTLPVAGLYLGSAGIHPGGGVNGMAGRLAARRVSRYLSKSRR
ncbi:NAD(P)/FAD-dependent oxidoreductase [Pseudomonas sp. GD03817]|uniref:Pyridine nucleotide-disulfide oxidoreductase domain-containing protein 2 n=1 Tax=Pseudomonas putida TaxID=303 RepID=A0A1L5PSZ3_PSEPU|nr:MULTISPECIES: NAD(P)/FAD-dependent oxidoreductase [Pseudomonas]APO83290.1 dehydrogenase [Pseudomonas putida]MBA6136330.1 NAD(P)/FAD-dependent oxidoreductase [Pseudomonas monteilii]MBF8804208.1 NAD(P)/FAD-dependent oxidoreductase [Pseudomonas asiatica]MCE0989611.1 NAD(P)/FAD-dependent oxidoreductase [Pseudomonas alloputida]MDH1400767.1 NAD(P)/FAD-dependent oxidoreductase [Pseudomonas sp. GD03730]